MITGRPFGFDETTLGVALTFFNLSTPVMFVYLVSKNSAKGARIGVMSDSFYDQPQIDQPKPVTADEQA